MRAGPERSLESALAALSSALNESRAPWMIIGGIALISRGVRRFTTDIHAAVRGDAIRLEDLLAVLIKPRENMIIRVRVAESPMAPPAKPIEHWVLSRRRHRASRP